MAENAHTLVRLSTDSRVTICKSITRSGPQLNFGEVISVPLTMSQAEDVANRLRAWIDEQLGADAPKGPRLALVQTDPDQPPPQAA